jgi:K+ transporter
MHLLIITNGILGGMLMMGIWTCILLVEIKYILKDLKEEKNSDNLFEIEES